MPDNKTDRKDKDRRPEDKPDIEKTLLGTRGSSQRDLLGSRRFKFNPSQPIEINLGPGMAIFLAHSIDARLWIELSLSITYRQPCRDPNRPQHHHFSRSIIVTITLFEFKEKPF